MARQRPSIPSYEPPKYATLLDHPEVANVTGVDFLGKRAPVPMGKTDPTGWNQTYAAAQKADEIRKRGGIKS